MVGCAFVCSVPKRSQATIKEHGEGGTTQANQTDKRPAKCHTGPTSLRVSCSYKRNNKNVFICYYYYCARVFLFSFFSFSFSNFFSSPGKNRLEDTTRVTGQARLRESQGQRDADGRDGPRCEQPRKALLASLAVSETQDPKRLPNAGIQGVLGHTGVQLGGWRAEITRDLRLCVCRSAIREIIKMCFFFIIIAAQEWLSRRRPQPLWQPRSPRARGRGVRYAPGTRTVKLTQSAAGVTNTSARAVPFSIALLARADVWWAVCV